ncbi:hypothetical protein V5F49_20370 [Xanthobacter sp. V3C-3]|uniref:hypothetical protein n=1 Tax=Xanthobacter lutulentifluminis TaxID=3119935 RepID=UPI003728038A
MLARAEILADHAALARGGATGIGVPDVETWTPIGALAGAIVDRLRMRMQNNRALVAFLAGMAMGDAYRELLRIAAVDRPGLKDMAQEIEEDALARVASFAALPLEGAAEIDGIMDSVRELARAHWQGSARTVAPRAVEPSPGGALNVPQSRRRGRPPMAAE